MARDRSLAVARPFEGGYSRFVAIMKLVLPLGAAVLIGLVVSWPSLYDVPERFQIGTTSFQFGESTGGHRMIKARYTGTDVRQNPYTLSADSIIQAVPGSDFVTLNQPEADFTTPGGAWVAVSASRGRFDRKNRTITLEGGVSVFHDSGYEFHTESATVDFDEAVAWSDTETRGQGPAAQIDARGFRIGDGAKRVSFKGPARMQLYADAARRDP